ncbi:MAG: DUF4417 domain-containing protein [Lachnospiraceae bacterium]|nr:DUF4417 domain-containing protein [Lachnospiraceae bacterium]
MKTNSIRVGCHDVFRAFLVNNATFDSELEIPVINPISEIPKKLIPFSKAIKSHDYNCYVHFYEDDVNFERVWNSPKTYLPILKKFSGVISPDFSLYRDMPLVMQYWNTYRGKALGHWFQENGINVIPNVRYGDRRTFLVSCAGIPKHGIISIGSYGCIKIKKDRLIFEEGLSFVINQLQPSTIIIYGATPESIFKKYKDAGITIIQFDSDYATKHQKAVG